MASTVSSNNHVLLTGLPGVGKTTLICSIHEILKGKNIPTVGFYTKEVRGNDGVRVGFDIITLDGHVGKLARANDALNSRESFKYKVGKYSVLIDEFERLALPVLVKPQSRDAIIIIDEIGKMELFSRPFHDSIKKLFETPNLKILATIPVAKGKPIPFIENLRSDPKNTVITVDRSNRNHLAAEISHKLQLNVE